MRGYAVYLNINNFLHSASTISIFENPQMLENFATEGGAMLSIFGCFSGGWGARSMPGPLHDRYEKEEPWPRLSHGGRRARRNRLASTR